MEHFSCQWDVFIILLWCYVSFLSKVNPCPLSLYGKQELKYSARYLLPLSSFSKITHTIHNLHPIQPMYNLFFAGFFDWKNCIYPAPGHIIRISSKSWFISLIPFKKWNFIHSTQTDIFQVFISFNDYKWQLMKTPNSVSQKIRILLKTNTKKGFLEILANWKVWTWKVWACTALNT